jgi:glycosyltransferase involved in cell wall biosynthesis
MEMCVKKPLVSIIITTYNYGLFIEKAIESVINQNFSSKDMEIIVIDDGSSDDTYEIVKKYKDKIKYIYKENKGQASALNVGFENSNGEYLILLDADDYFREDKVLKVVEEFEKYGEVGYVGNGFKYVDKEGKEIRGEIRKIEFHNLKMDERNFYLIKNGLRGPSGISLRKSHIIKILPIPEDLKYAADIYLNGSLLWFTNFSFLKDELTYVRIHGENVGIRYKREIDTLNYHINAMKRALFYIKKNSEKSGNYAPSIFKKSIKPLEIEIMEKEFLLSYLLNRPKKKDLLHIEIEHLKLCKEWSPLYKFYRILRLPVLFLFSPKFYVKLKEHYSESFFYKLRKKIFPEFIWK